MTMFPDLSAAQILLIVEDFDIGEILQTSLVSGGYNVRKAYGVDSAKFAVQYTSFDLALIEANMLRHVMMEYSGIIENRLLFGKIPWVPVFLDDTESIPINFTNDPIYLNLPSQSLLSTVASAIDKSSSILDSVANLVPSNVTSEVREQVERKMREYETLSSIARMLTSSLQINTVLTKVVEAATSLTNAEEGLLLMPDERGDSLYIRAHKGIDTNVAEEFRIKTEDSVAGKVLKTGRPVISGDEGLQKVKTAYLVKSLLYVPMISRSNVIGVLGVNNRESDRKFTHNDRDLLLDLASHAAIAIENARLYTESVMRSRELGILFNAAQAVNSSLDLENVLSIIAKQLAIALDIGRCDVYLLTKDDTELEELISYRQCLWDKKSVVSRQYLEMDLLTKSIEKQRRLIVPYQILEDGSPAQEYMKSNGGKLLILFPLVTHNSIVGVFELMFCNDLPESSLNLKSSMMQEFAIKLMVAVESTSIYSREVMKRVEELLHLTSADFCTLYKWDEQHERFHRRWTMGQASWVNTERPSLSINLTIQDVLDNDETIFLSPQFSTDIETTELLEKFIAESVMIMPLTIANEVEGVVFLSDMTRKEAFSDRKVDLAQALISQAANAINNAQLYRDLQSSLQELQHAQSKLIQSARLSAMGEIAAAIAHQINNPLTTVIGDSQMILQDIEPSHRDYESIAAIHRAGNRAHEVVRRLLAMVHQRDEQEHAKPMDINRTIQNTLALVSKHIEQFHIRLIIQLEEDLPLAYGLPGQLEDVWMNLLLNARDAVTTKTNPHIGIASRLSKDGENALIQVWDNGTGIPEEKQSSIFDAFFTTKDEGEGTGLGLHICRQVVEKCNGTISLESSSERGTTFLVTLPVVDDNV